MDKETITNNDTLLPEAKVGKVTDWGEMKTYLPKDIGPRRKKLLRAYFGGQLLVLRGKKVKVRRRWKLSLENPQTNSSRWGPTFTALSHFTMEKLEFRED